MADNVPPHVAAYLAWRDAPPDQKDELVRGHTNYRNLLPSPDALRDNPGAVIGPSGKPLAESTGAELGEFLEWFRVLRDAAVARARAVEIGASLAGLCI